MANADEALSFVYDVLCDDISNRIEVPDSFFGDMRELTRVARDENLMRILHKLEFACDPNQYFRSDYTTPRAKKLYPIVNGMINGSLEDRMQSLMAYALDNPDRHAYLLFRLYKELFYDGEFRSFPSQRLKSTADEYEFDSSLTAQWERSMRKDPAVVAAIGAYRDWVTLVWAPYLKLHEPLVEAVREHLKYEDPNSVVYQDLFMAIGLSPVATGSTGGINYNFRIL